MTFDLPEHGDKGWHVKLNSSITFAKGVADQGVSDAAEAKSVADEALAGVQTYTGLADDDVSALVNDSGSSTRSALSGVYVDTSLVGAASGVASLDAGGAVPDGEIPGTITRDTELDAVDAAKVDRTSRAKHAPALGLFFPEAEGASADGTTDDNTALVATLTAAAGKGTVHLERSKTYGSGTQLSVPADSRIAGGGTIKMLAASTFRALLIQNVSDVQVEDITIDLNKASTTNGGNTNQQQGIYLSATSTSMTRITLQGVRVINGHQRGIHASASSPHAFTDLTVDRCAVESCDDNGIQLTAQGEADKSPSLSRRIDITRCRVLSPGNVGIQVTGMSDVDVSKNVIDGGGVSVQSGIVFSSSGTNSHVTDFTCSRNKITGHTDTNRWGIVVSVDCTRFAVTTNTVRGCTGGISVDPENGGATGVRVAVDATVANNTVTASVGSTSSHGIHARLCEHLTISSNTSRGNAGAGVLLASAFGCAVIANTVNGNGTYGVQVSGTASGSGGHHIGPNAAQDNDSGDKQIAATPVSNTVLG